MSSIAGAAACRVAHHATSESATTPASELARKIQRRRASRRRSSAIARAVIASPSPVASSVAVDQRSSGSLASARPITRSTPAGTSGNVTRSDGTGPARWPATTACADGPVYGGSPTSISYATHPRA